MCTDIKKERKYANFFEGGPKEQKELFVSQEWLNTYGISKDYDESTLSLVDDQWPDCQIETYSGDLCGIEVTELVDKDCIQLNERGEDVYRLWSDDEVIEAISKRLRIKNTKTHGGKYSKIIVLIHTDELEILFREYNELVSNHKFNKMDNIDEAYLLYSYDTGHGNYPVSVLNIKA